MRKLTPDENKVMAQGRTDLFDSLEGTESNYTLMLLNATYRQAFTDGLSHNQAKLDKLIAYIKGKITRSEIEELLK